VTAPDLEQFRLSGDIPELVDTHCHLDAPAFAGEPVEAILERARAAGVRRVVTIGTDLDSSRRAATLASAHFGVYAAVGVDPNDAATFDAGTEEELAELAQQPGVVAVGEIGLDYYWDRAGRARQAMCFEQQLELAGRFDRPVVVHSRDAADDTASILEAWSAGRAVPERRPLGVMHCFSGDTELAYRYVQAGFLISLAGNVTYASAAGLHRVAAEIPLDHLVLETDSPYLAPRTHRGRRNEPALVLESARFVAELRHTDLAEVARATTANAARLFRWPSAGLAA
jgi:TatD DNase family protein